MSEDLMNISLSKHASGVADSLMETKAFDDALTVAKFGMAYAVKYYMNELDTLEKLDALGECYDSLGKNYNVGSVDSDHYIADLMFLLYPGITTPYRYAISWAIDLKIINFSQSVAICKEVLSGKSISCPA